MTEERFIEVLESTTINEISGDLLKCVKTKYSEQELNVRLVNSIIFMWEDYIKSYENQLRATHVQGENEKLQKKLEYYIGEAAKQNQRLREQQDELEELKIQRYHDKRNLEMYEKCIKEFGERQVNLMKVKHGRPIAYKTNAGLGKVLALHRQGLTQKEIAEYLGVGETTIYRRFKELKEAGLMKREEH